VAANLAAKIGVKHGTLLLPAEINQTKLKFAIICIDAVA
jgi:hypothetical protein